MSALLEVLDLNVYYGNIHAVKGIDLVVEKGEIVSLIGANGAGKTTILQTISGLIPSSTGSISFCGENITKRPAHEIVKIGIAQVPEGRLVFPNLSVEDNIQLGAVTSRESNDVLKKRKEDFFEIFPRMRERRNQMAGTLSGGEQQMLAMSRALMSDPELLILDEPSMGLSPIFVQEIFNVIEEVNRAGKTILLVEQNAHMALEISDRAYVLETGHITLEGRGKDLMNNEKVKSAYLGI